MPIRGPADITAGALVDLDLGDPIGAGRDVERLRITPWEEAHWSEDGTRLCFRAEPADPERYVVRPYDSPYSVNPRRLTLVQG